MSLEGSWCFEVTHKDAVYMCSVDDERVRIESPSGMITRAKWTGKQLDDWTSDEGDIPDEELPQEVCEEVESQMRAMAEAVP